MTTDAEANFRSQCAALVARLRAQGSDLYEAIHAHVRDANPDRAEEDVEYGRGRYDAVVAVVDHALNRIEHGECFCASAPRAAIAQARSAARHGVPLDVVLRRYHAGEALLQEVVRHEVEQDPVLDQPATLRLMQGLHDLLNRLTAEIAAEYELEIAENHSPQAALAERIRQLLAGTSLDTTGIDYHIDNVWHICVIALGETADRAISKLAGALNRDLLPLRRSGDIVCAWLGGSRASGIADVQSLAARSAGASVQFAIGEPARGLPGWRVTYGQAQAALRIALLDPQTVTRYADIALVEGLLRDEALAASYVACYLSPLNSLSDGGRTAREALRAYFEAGHQVQSTASKLGVNRSTLRRHLREIEGLLGYELRKRQAELEVALRIERLLFTRPRTTPVQPTRNNGTAWLET